MKLVRTTALVIVAFVGCSRENDSVHSKTATPASGEIVTMDPNEILFTTPTLNDAIPATAEGSAVASDCIRCSEDDWRQFEFVAAILKREVDAELNDIGVIWDDNSVPLGESSTAFRRIHIRKRIPNALNISMPLAAFETLVGQKTGPMTFFGYDEVLRDVHAVKIDKLAVYALIQDDTVTTIGLNAVDQVTLPPEFLARLSKFVQDHRLMLVHWPSRTLFDSHQDVMAYFGVGG